MESIGNVCRARPHADVIDHLPHEPVMYDDQSYLIPVDPRMLSMVAVKICRHCGSIYGESEMERIKRSMADMQSALPNDHPMKKAWNKWQESDEFKNALKWSIATKYDDGRPIDDVQREQHAKGAMWLAFTKGMEGPII